MKTIAFKMIGIVLNKMDYSINNAGKTACLKKNPPQEKLGKYFYNCRIAKSL